VDGSAVHAVIGTGSAVVRENGAANGRVDGSAVHAVIGTGSAVVRENGAANNRRVDGEPVHPTRRA
jgi:hypothetical protein